MVIDCRTQTYREYLIHWNGHPTLLRASKRYICCVEEYLLNLHPGWWDSLGQWGFVWYVARLLNGDIHPPPVFPKSLPCRLWIDRILQGGEGGSDGAGNDVSGAGIVIGG